MVYEDRRPITMTRAKNPWQSIHPKNSVSTSSSFISFTTPDLCPTLPPLLRGCAVTSWRQFDDIWKSLTISRVHPVDRSQNEKIQMAQLLRWLLVSLGADFVCFARRYIPFRRLDFVRWMMGAGTNHSLPTFLLFSLLEWWECFG